MEYPTTLELIKIGCLEMKSDLFFRKSYVLKWWNVFFVLLLLFLF